MSQKHLTALFKPYGEIKEINVPAKSGNVSLNRGFAFVEFESKDQAESAITKLNDSKWKGRTITVNHSIPKGSYETKMESIVEHTNLDR